MKGIILAGGSAFASHYARRYQSARPKIACLEEIARRNGWLDDDGLKRAPPVSSRKTCYGQYLLEFARARPRQY